MALTKTDKIRLFQQMTGWSVDKMRANKKQINALLNDESISFIEQELTEEQKAQARQNINAANDSEVVKYIAQEVSNEQKTKARENINAANDSEVVKHVQQNLTSEQQAQVRENIDVLSMIETFGYLQSLGIDASYDDYMEWVYSQNPLKRPLTIEATEDNTVVIFSNVPRADDPDIFGEEMTIEFSIDNGRTWNNVNSIEGLICTLNAGEKVELRGNNSCYNGHRIIIYKECYLYGNIMSMLSSNNFETLNTIEENYCFAGFFENNYYSNKENYDIYLPATTLSERCYKSMFEATNITKAPELPATTLTTGCYERMFSTCLSLTSCPNLPSINIAVACYLGMFVYCTHLTSVTELPATTLKEACYKSMFESCTSLVNAQKELPANTLSQYSYGSMFKGCTELKESPLLCNVNNNSIPPNCYNSMFEGCSNLDKVNFGIKRTLPFTTIRTAFQNFLKNVSPTGTIIVDLTSTTGPSTFSDNGNTIGNWKREFYNAFIIHLNAPFNFRLISNNWQYSINGGNWNRKTTAVSLSEGTKIYIKAYSSLQNNTIPAQGVYDLVPTSYVEEAEYSISGDIAALLFSNATPNPTNRCIVANAFGQSNSRNYMVSAANLKLLNESNMANSCYAGLFRNCGKLIDAPKLPAINLTEQCYRQMFIGCTSLSSAPELPAKTLAGGCYIEMFKGCTSLSYVKALFNEPGNNTLTDWLTDVASTGTYVKSKDATYEPTTIGVPQDWTIETAAA